VTRQESAAIQRVEDLLRQHADHEQQWREELKREHEELRQEMREGFHRQDTRLTQLERRMDKTMGGRQAVLWVISTLIALGAIVGALFSPWKL
jgi:hypothetical protein